MSSQKLIRPLCACDKILNKNKKKFCRKYDIEADFSVAKKRNEKNRVVYNSDSSIKNLDPYTGSITGFCNLNLDFYNHQFHVFYPNEKNNQVNNVLEFFSGQSLDLQEWTPEQKNNHSLALQHAFDLIGAKLVEVDNFNDADFVIGNIKEYLDTTGYVTLPFELDVYNVFKEKMYIFYSGLYNSDETAPGSYWFHAFLHFIGHSLGLAHPETSGSGSRIMPGSGYQENIKNNNLGLFSMNSILTTQMSSISQSLPYISSNDSVDWQSTSYPRTYMTLDLKALRFLYNITDISPEFLKWTNNSCENGITQLLVSDSQGLTLKLEPNADNFSPSFLLSLDPFSGNPGIDSISSFSLVSRPAQSVSGASILDSESFISRVLNNYEELNVQSSKFYENTEIVISGSNAKKINLYLSGFQKDYDISDETNGIEIVSKNNNKKLSILYNGFDVDVNLVLFGRNQILDYEHAQNFQKEEIPPNNNSPETNAENIGKFIIENLKQEHYDEIVDSFFEVNSREELSNISEPELIHILNDYAVSFITERFKHKLIGIPLPLMANTVKTKR